MNNIEEQKSTVQPYNDDILPSELCVTFALIEEQVEEIDNLNDAYMLNVHLAMYEGHLLLNYRDNIIFKDLYALKKSALNLIKKLENKGAN